MDSDYEKYLKYKLKYLKLKKIKQNGSGRFINFNSNQKRLKSEIKEDYSKKKRRFAQPPIKLEEEIDMIDKQIEDEGGPEDDEDF